MEQPGMQVTKWCQRVPSHLASAAPSCQQCACRQRRALGRVHCWQGSVAFCSSRTQPAAAARTCLTLAASTALLANRSSIVMRATALLTASSTAHGRMSTCMSAWGHHDGGMGARSRDRGVAPFLHADSLRANSAVAMDSSTRVELAHRRRQWMRWALPGNRRRQRPAPPPRDTGC